MSHSVTITRTTTTTTTSAILLNTGYLKSLPGLLKLAQVVIGSVVIGLVATTIMRYRNYYNTSEELFFLVIACACLLATGCLLISCLISISTASIIAKTIFELVYHGVAFALQLVASILALIQATGSGRNANNELYLAASILGLINSALYLLSTILAYKSYRGG
ncbi:hypothetical protein B566_EDAN007046 [Ephemera danica]|nr:hypothetical protein B566_EDAN007046 [Ephemera danica]